MDPTKLACCENQIICVKGLTIARHTVNTQKMPIYIYIYPTDVSFIIGKT